MESTVTRRAIALPLHNLRCVSQFALEEFLDADIEEASIEGWDSEVPVHGDYPWEYAHIDHTLMDVVLRHTDKGVIMGRAWVTLLIDSFSRLVLAYYITYDSPSYRSCMGVIRECVRVHARLPECMIADGGVEFKSIYFQTLMARRNVNIIWRPATKPRFGAVIEQFIHTLNKQFLHNLMGNTKIMKNVRRYLSSQCFEGDVRGAPIVMKICSDQKVGSMILCSGFCDRY